MGTEPVGGNVWWLKFFPGAAIAFLLYRSYRATKEATGRRQAEEAERQAAEAEAQARQAAEDEHRKNIAIWGQWHRSSTLRRRAGAPI